MGPLSVSPIGGPISGSPLYVIADDRKWSQTVVNIAIDCKLAQTMANDRKSF